MSTYPKNFPSHFPGPKKEEQEYGKGKENILICKACSVYYFYKSWHHRIEDYPELKETKNLKFTICPACQMIKDEKYEGEIILENVPEDFREEIKKIAKNFGQRAFEKDPMDRIISIEEKDGERPTNVRKRGAVSRKEFRGQKDIQILTTENQLAQRLAKKIKETFDGNLKVSFGYSKKDSVLRAKIIF